MNRFVRGLASGSVLALAILFVVAVPVALADDDAKAAQKDVLDLAKASEEGKPIDKARLEAIKKKYDDLDTIMHSYKPRDKGGIGVGPKGKSDGIEIKLNNLGKKPLAKMQLDKEADELIKVAHINAAIADITKLYVPKPKGGKGPKEWNEYAEAMKKSSLEFAKAVKSGDPKAVQKAANNVNASCTNCHSDFRDS
jgi:hypothetical protein